MKQENTVTALCDTFGIIGTIVQLRHVGFYSRSQILELAIAGQQSITKLLEGQEGLVSKTTILH